MIAFDVAAASLGFPFAEQAARLTRCLDNPKKKPAGLETEYLLTSRACAQMDAGQMLHSDRAYWRIETSLHLRLDVIAGEDRSRVRSPNAALNLAVLRRAVASLAIHWAKRQTTRRPKTMSDFYDFMSASNSKQAFKLVTASKNLTLSKR